MAYFNNYAGPDYERRDYDDIDSPRPSRRREQRYRDDDDLLPQANADEPVRRRVRTENDEPRQRRTNSASDRPKQRDSKKTSRRSADKPAKPRTPFREWGIVKFITDKRVHAFLGVALFFVAVYVAVASISFLHAGGADQSVVTSMPVSKIVESGTKVENLAGPAGAKLANSIIVEGLGLGAVALVGYLFLLGLSLMGFRRYGFWSVTFKTLLVAITISMVLGLVSLWFGMEFNLGGYHGHYINMLLVSYIDWVGAALVSALLLMGVFYVYINDLLSLYNRYKALKNARRAKAEQTRMQMERDRERVRQAMADADISAGDASDAVDEQTPDDENRPEISVGFEDFNDESEDIYALGENERSHSENADSNQAYAHSEPESAPLYQSEESVTAEPSAAAPEPPAYTETYSPAPVTTGAPTAAETENATDNMPSLEVVTNSIEEAKSTDTSVYDPTAELSRYKLPGLDLLRDIPTNANCVDRAEQEENKERITKTLNDYGIAISHIHATVGPTVTLYEIIPAEGVRIAKIKRLEDDIAMTLAALGIRIIAPIPGKGTIGIEVPNKDPQTVSIRSILGSKKFQECKQQLPMAMGATISNEVYIADLAKMPHLLVAGATGMGKSVGLNTIIASLLYKKHPAELKFVLIDPKMVEFSLYSVLERHYLAKLPDEEDAVVTSMDKVLATLNSLCVEMDQRYMLLRDANVRSITEYNERFVEKRLNPEKGHRYLPYIVMIVDELADLIMTAGKEVEKPIARIAQKARAVGMHMIIATQRPSTNVITGIIKANFPGRIAFRVSQMVDSKTILDRTGANQLIGRGDMLFSHNGSLDRVQCAFIDTPEVQAICDHIDSQAGYEHAYYLPEPVIENEGGGAGGSLTDRDPLFEEAAEIVVNTGVASTSSLQRRYSIGYNRAGKIMDQLEAAGIVGPAQGGKPRTVLVDQMQLGSIIRSFE